MKDYRILTIYKDNKPCEYKVVEMVPHHIGTNKQECREYIARLIEADKKREESGKKGIRNGA